MLVDPVEVSDMVDDKKPRPAPAPASSNPDLKNEGEGSRTAARRYDAGAEKMAKSGRVDELGKEAEAALDGEEGDELKHAEEQAKRAQLPPPR